MSTKSDKASKLAKVTTAKKRGSKVSKKVEDVKVEDVVDAREAFDNFNPRNRTFENYSGYCRANHIRLNQTGRDIIVEGDESKQFKLLNNHVLAFAEASTRWVANEQYGRQHYNKSGFMHRDGLTRLPDESLAMLMAQVGEELAQRAAFKGTEATNKRVNPDTAAAMLRSVCKWGLQRTSVIAENRRIQAYKEVEAETGIMLNLVNTTE